MEIKDFIGKAVINSETRARYLIREINSPFIKVETDKPKENGRRSQYLYNTINGDPIANGTLVFEDAALTEPFKAAYSAYCNCRNSYWEDYGYWMRKD